MRKTFGGDWGAAEGEKTHSVGRFTFSGTEGLEVSAEAKNLSTCWIFLPEAVGLKGGGWKKITKNCKNLLFKCEIRVQRQIYHKFDTKHQVFCLIWILFFNTIFWKGNNNCDWLHSHDMILPLLPISPSAPIHPPLQPTQASITKTPPPPLTHTYTHLHYIRCTYNLHIKRVVCTRCD